MSNIGFPFRDMDDTEVTCEFGRIGKRWKSGRHDGVDLVSTNDKTILAITAGKVIFSSSTGAFGEHIVVQMADKRSIVYAHMVKGSRKVSAGQTVSVGQELGTMGNTTSNGTMGVHLHIELQKNYYKSGYVDSITDFLGIENEVGSVKLMKKDLTIKLPSNKTITVKAINDNGTNYVALRDVLEGLGYTVGFTNGVVTIKNIK